MRIPRFRSSVGVDPHAYGLMVTALGVVIISPDSLLIRLAAEAGSINTIFWRNLFVGAALLLVLALHRRGRIAAAFDSLDRWAWLSVGLLCLTNLGFVVAVNTTTVANVLVIMATMPLFAALLARVWLGEAIRRRTAVATMAAIAGIAIIVSGSLGGVHLTGDLVALAVTMLHGANLVVLRRAAGTPLLPVLILAAFAAAAVILPAAQPFAVGAEAMGWIALSGLVQMPLGFVLFFAGLRWVGAAEVALMALLETVLGPLWVWAGLGEVPDDRALLGGALVLAAIIANAGLALRRPGETPTRRGLPRR